MPQNWDAEDRAVAVFFSVQIDDHDLGAFTKCEGLSVEVVIEPREEGGVNNYVHQLPGRMKFTNIKLTRAVNADSVKITDWLASMGGVVKRGNAAIVARTYHGEPLITWSITGVVPVKWQGPSFSSESAKLATETLELAHHGFAAQAGS